MRGRMIAALAVSAVLLGACSPAVPPPPLPTVEPGATADTHTGGPPGTYAVTLVAGGGPDEESGQALDRKLFGTLAAVASDGGLWLTVGTDNLATRSTDAGDLLRIGPDGTVLEIPISSLDQTHLGLLSGPVSDHAGGVLVVLQRNETHSTDDGISYSEEGVVAVRVGPDGEATPWEPSLPGEQIVDFGTSMGPEVVVRTVPMSESTWSENRKYYAVDPGTLAVQPLSDTALRLADGRTLSSPQAGGLIVTDAGGTQTQLVDPSRLPASFDDPEYVNRLNTGRYAGPWTSIGPASSALGPYPRIADVAPDGRLLVALSYRDTPALTDPAAMRLDLAGVPDGNAAQEIADAMNVAMNHPDGATRAGSVALLGPDLSPETPVVIVAQSSRCLWWTEGRIVCATGAVGGEHTGETVVWTVGEGG